MRKILVGLCVLVGFAVSAAEQEQVVDGVTWSYSVQNGEAMISAKCVPSAGLVAIPGTLGGYPVTKIGQAIFYQAAEVTEVQLPSSVREIVGWAFCQCPNLTRINLPESLCVLGESVFSGTALESIVLPVGLTRIEADTFHGCTNLVEVLIPSGVESMGRSAFYHCTGLKKVEFPSSFKKFDAQDYLESHWAFGGCRNLEEVRFNGAVPSGFSTSGLQNYGKIFYPKAHAADWEKIVTPARFGGYTDDIGKEPEPVPPLADGSVVTNFVYVTVTNVVEHHHYTTVTNVVEHHHYTTMTNVVEHHHYTTVSNVVEYVPAPGMSPAPAYPAQAGGAFSQVVAGAAGWDVLELPEGMSWDSSTGTLGGTPVRSGTYDLILVSGSGADTKMMRTTVEVAGFEPIVGYVGTAFAWMGAPVTMFADYKGLPAGLKWSAAAGTLAGVPTKAGDFSRATTYGDAVSFTVLDLPATAVGTFNGLVSLNGTNYPVLVTATKAGKLTAKIALGAKTLFLPAASWGGWKREGGRLLFTATCASKTDAVEPSLDADADWDADQMAVSVTAGVLAGATGSAQRADFASGAAQAAAVAVAGSYTLDCEAVAGGYRLMAPEGGKVGAMAVVLKPNGAATLKGKYDGKTAVSASATLHMDGEGMRSLTFFYKGMQFTWEW